MILGEGRVSSAAVRDGQFVLAGVTRDGTSWVRTSVDGERWIDIDAPVTLDFAPLAATIGPSGQIGLASTGCQGAGSSPAPGSTLWRTTSDLGVTWSEPELVPGCPDEPELAWGDAGPLVILDGGLDGYDLKLRLEDQP